MDPHLEIKNNNIREPVPEWLNSWNIILKQEIKLLVALHAVIAALQGVTVVMHYNELIILCPRVCAKES